MRITFVLPHAGLAGGIRVLAIYANLLQKRGHHVTVVSVPISRIGLRRKFKTFLQTGLWPTEIAEQSHFDGTAIRPHVIEVNRPVVDSDVPEADVIVATFWRTGPWVSAMSSSKGAKAIFLQGYETSPNQWDSEIDRVWRLPLHKIVVSSWLKELAWSRFADSDVDCVPNSVDTQVFSAPPRGKQHRPTAGFLYSSGHFKGVDVTLAALAEAKRALPELRVIAFGAEHVSKRLPLPKWIEYHYRPTQAQICEIYGMCDVWVCGSRQEGFHLPPLEAMACRSPVVSTRVGGPQDIINTGENGFLVEVDDYKALARYVLHVLKMKEATWRIMSDAAFATATGYSWDDATDLFEESLVKLASCASLLRCAKP